MRFLLLFFIFGFGLVFGQNFSFDFNTHGRRVCPVSSVVNSNVPNVTITFHDSGANTTEPIIVNRRAFGTSAWTNVATNLPAGTANWIDTNVALGDVWEYQVIRENTWTYNSVTYDAIGYTIGAVLPDKNTNYKGQMILLVANDIPSGLATKYNRLKTEITADGWFVNELIVPKATNWDSGNAVVGIKNQITTIYNNAPTTDKPKILFILGHVPLPRSGSADITAPDGHPENRGARGADSYYADIDGVFTDNATYNPGGLSTPLAVNIPGDSKWDQDYIPTELEMAFGRVDFFDVSVNGLSELNLIEGYLDKLSNYKNVITGFDMGNKSGFNIGFENSTDASYRSLLNISTPSDVYQNYTGANHSQWIQTNGPFKVYMQNVSPPDFNEWNTIGMDATVFSSDQSYWGFNDVPNSLIRSVLAIPTTKNLVTLWTTSAINIFHQSCTGIPLGLAMKTIIDHNNTNQYLEKPQNDWDTPVWWNRTHLTFNGDPTLNLYQITPPTNISLNEVSGNAQLQWTSSTDTNVIGYHIYESTTEFGIYNRITTSVVNTNTFDIPSYQTGNWYMVKAIKPITSGCGQFLHASLGKNIQGNITLNTEELTYVKNMTIAPNPTSDFVKINSEVPMTRIEIYTTNGQLIDTQKVNDLKKTEYDFSTYENGLYFIRVYTLKNEIIKSFKLIKID